MNASFRTAFWAMCLGLAVPMTLFVGGTVTSEAQPQGKRPIAARKDLPPGGSTATPAPKAPNGHRASDGPGATLIPRLEPAEDVADALIGGGHRLPAIFSGSPAGVVLDPRLELDPTGAADLPFTRPPLAATPTATQSRLDLVPPPKAALPASESRIESQLERILDQLRRMEKLSSERAGTSDPMDQAAELLLRLQQAQKVQELAAGVPRLAASPIPEALTDATTAEKSVTDLPWPETEDRAKPSSGPTPAAPFAAPVVSAQTKIYRPRHIQVKALETLVTPLLTAGLGRVAAAGADGNAFDGETPPDAPTQWDALVVRDTPEVLRKVDRLLLELDIPPREILLEATVLTVRLDSHRPYGLDLAEFNAAGQAFSVSPAELASEADSGASRGYDGTHSAAPVLRHGVGVKCGVLRGDARAFLNLLHTVTEVRGTAALQTTIVNKHVAEIRLSDGRAVAADGARPASEGSLLRIRPIVTRDGLIHLDLKPVFGAEESNWNGAILAQSGGHGNQLTLRAGETAVVGGLIADHQVTWSYRKPGIGNVPFLGRWFREDGGSLERTETIVLLTPHIGESSGVPPLPGVKPDGAGRKSRRPAPLVSKSAARSRTTVRQTAVDTPSSDGAPQPPARLDSYGRPIPEPELRDVPERAGAPTPADSSSRAIQQTGALEPAVDRPARRTGGERAPAAPRRATPARSKPPALDEIPVVPDETHSLPGPIIRPASSLR